MLSVELAFVARFLALCVVFCGFFGQKRVPMFLEHCWNSTSCSQKLQGFNVGTGVLGMLLEHSWQCKRFLKEMGMCQAINTH